MTALAGRTAVVAGGSRGIGAAVAQALGHAGAGVVRLARSLDDASDDGPPPRRDFRCDVTDAGAVTRVRDAVLAAGGTPDILVLSAGAFLLKPVEHTTPAEFRDQLHANLAGPFTVLWAFLPALRDAGRGHVVTLGSIADHRALPGNAAYGASKTGLRGLHDVLEAELADSGVRFSLVSPGPTDTSLWDTVDPDTRDDLPDRADMLRPEDVAQAVCWVLTRPARVHVPLLRVMPA